MKNTQKDKQKELSTITYSRIFKELENSIEDIVLRNYSNGRTFKFENLHDISLNVARNLYKDALSEDGFKRLFNVDYSCSPQDITLNLTDEKLDSISIKRLCEKIDNTLKISSLKLIGDQLDKYKINNNHIKRNRGVNFGANFEEDITAQIKFAKSLPDEDANKASENHLKEDKVIVKYDCKDLKEELKNALIAFMETEEAEERNVDEDNIDEIIEEIEKNEFLTKDLYDFITKQQKGCLSRVSNFLYLDFALSNIDEDKLTEIERKQYKLFSNYVKRFEMFEDFCTQSLLDNSAYSFTINKPISLLDEFRKSDVYGFLPIIGKQTTNTVFANNKDLTKSIEQSGVSFKFDGGVSNHDLTSINLKGKKIQTSLEYNLECISQILEDVKIETTENKEGKLKKALVRTLLIKFFLTNLGDENYNPVEALKKDLEPIYSIQDTSKAAELIREIHTQNTSNYGVSMKANVEYIKTLLKKSLEPNFIASKGCSSKTYNRYLLIFPGILPKDISEEALNYMSNKKPRTHKIRYTTLTKEILTRTSTLFSIDYEIKFESSFIKQGSNLEDNVKSSFEFGEFLNINMIFYPQHKKAYYEKASSEEAFQNEIDKYNAINLSAYENVKLFKNIYLPYLIDDEIFDSEIGRFIYTNTYTALVTCLISVITEHSKSQGLKKVNCENLHINLMRIHGEPKEGTYNKYTKANDFIAMLSKRLSIVLRQKYNINAQGFDLTANEKQSGYRYGNAIRSMYSTLPQSFILNSKRVLKTDKIAMIVATSMVHDKATTWSNINENYSSLLGEVILFDSNEHKTIVKKDKTFCKSYAKEELFKNPLVLKDLAVELKNKGYKNVIFLAQAPYTTKMLEGMEDQELYFMNESVINTISLNGELNVYPLFYNTSSVLDCRNAELKKRGAVLYIDDTNTLTKTLYKELNGIVPVLNLYSAHVNTQLNQESFYNSLIQYLTLRGIYSDDSINKNIANNLIDGELKRDIARALAIYHFANFQKDQRGKLDIKINPYANLLGDDGIAKKSRDEYNLHPNQRGNGYSYPRYIYHNSFVFCNFVAQNAFNYRVDEDGECSENEEEIELDDVMIESADTIVASNDEEI